MRIAATIMLLLSLLALARSSRAIDPEDRQVVEPTMTCGFGGNLAESSKSSPILLRKRPIPANLNCKDEFDVPANAAVVLVLGLSLSGRPQDRCDGNFLSIQYTNAATNTEVNRRLCGMFDDMERRIEKVPKDWKLKISLLNNGPTNDWIDSKMYVELEAPAPTPYFDCGKLPPLSHVSSRIIGGQEASPYSIPWQVAVVTKAGSKEPEFGGGLVSPRHVMTVAHRVYGRTQIPMSVLVGEHYVDKVEDGDLHEVACIKIHPNYTRFGNRWNFAVLILRTPVKINGDSRARAVCLPGRDWTEKTYKGKMLMVSGWGSRLNGRNTRMSNVLHYVEVPVVSTAQCRRAYPGWITVDMICAGHFDDGGIDSCHGDGGGPLTAFMMGKRFLVGLTGWGNGCGKKGYPGVYSEVSAALPWLMQQGIYDENPKC